MWGASEGENESKFIYKYADTTFYLIYTKACKSTRLTKSKGTLKRKTMIATGDSDISIFSPCSYTYANIFAYTYANIFASPFQTLSVSIVLPSHHKLYPVPYPLSIKACPLHHHMSSILAHILVAHLSPPQAPTRSVLFPSQHAPRLCGVWRQARASSMGAKHGSMPIAARKHARPGRQKGNARVIQNSW